MKPLLAQMSLAVPAAVANYCFVRKHAASKTGCFGMCSFRCLFAVPLAMRGSFIPATTIITWNDITATADMWKSHTVEAFVVRADFKELRRKPHV